MLLFIVFAPLATALLVLAGAPARLTSLIGSAATAIVALIAWCTYNAVAGGFQFVTSWTINSSWGWHFSLGADGLTVIMLFLAALVLLCAIWFTPTIEKSEGLFYACLLFIASGAIGAFASLDLFFFYAFHELALIPTFLLIGMWGTGNRFAAAWKITIYLALGSFVLLIGLILLYHSVPAAARSLDLRALQTASAAIPAARQNTIFLLLLIGFGTLISLFPLHSWAPEAYASAPPPAAMLHAGVLKKFGLYGLLRIALPMLPEGARHWSSLLLVLLLGNIIYIGLVTIAQKRLDWMLGYSSVMHMGYIFLGIVSANIIGVNGAALLMFAHGISIALLFALAGEIRHRTGTLIFAELGGLGKLMPFTGFAFGVATFAAIGLPGFANFAAEVMVFFGAFHVGANFQRLHFFQIAVLLALWGVVISAVYLLRAYRAIFMGPLPNEQSAALPDMARTLRWPVILLIAATLVVGFYPNVALRILRPTFTSALAANSP